MERAERNALVGRATAAGRKIPQSLRLAGYDWDDMPDGALRSGIDEGKLMADCEVVKVSPCGIVVHSAAEDRPLLPKRFTKRQITSSIRISSENKAVEQDFAGLLANLFLERTSLHARVKLANRGDSDFCLRLTHMAVSKQELPG